MPCAYPGEGKFGCLRDKRLKGSVVRYRVREYFLRDPWLEVRFRDGEGWPIGVFLHPSSPLLALRGDEDYLHFNDEHTYERAFHPSPALLKALRRVLDEP